MIKQICDRCECEILRDMGAKVTIRPLGRDRIDQTYDLCWRCRNAVRDTILAREEQPAA